MKILVTGGMGYLGSHLCLQMHQRGIEAVALDMWNECSRHHLEGLRRLQGRPVRYVEGWSGDPAVVRRVLRQEGVQAVVHLEHSAALEHPRGNLDTQVAQTLDPVACLLNEMEGAGVFNLHVASSADVYAAASRPTPIRETAARLPGEARGINHMILEELIAGLPRADRRWKLGIYRLFSVGGSHASALLGPLEMHERQRLIPRACQAAADGTAAVIASDMPTEDGSPVRDFVHVEDAAAAVLAGVEAMDTYGDAFTVNVGTGRGVSALQALDAVRRAAQRDVAWHRRTASLTTPLWQIADMAFAQQVLGWRARRSLDDIAQSAWAWFITNRARLQPV